MKYEVSTELLHDVDASILQKDEKPQLSYRGCY